MRDGFPPGWSTTPLNSLCEKLRGVSYKRDEASPIPRDGYLPILRAGNIDADRLTFNELVWVPASRVSGQQKLRKGDVVVAMSSGSKSVVGKTAQAREDWEGAFGAFCGVLRPSPKIDSRYLGLFLRTREYRAKISDLAAGSNINNLKNEHFAEIEVPLPPLPEQRRIVAKLEKLLAKVDTCENGLAKIPVLLKRFRQSVLAAACSGRLTADWREKNPVSPVGATSETDAEDLPVGWESVCVGDVIENLKYGTAQKCSYEKRGVPVLRIPNVVDGTIDQADLKYAELSPKELAQLRLHPGDILLIRSNGSVSLVGRCALVREQERSFAYAGYLIRIRPRRTIVESEFLNLALSSYNVRLQIELEARSTSGVNNINSEEVRTLRFSLPPLAEQKEIVRRVEALFALADQIEARCARAKVHAGNLTQSILAKAFRGELVPSKAELV